MNSKKKLLFLIPSLLTTFLMPNYAMAALNNVTIPKTGKVIICHYPPGNIANVQNITISVSSLNAHLWNGIAGDQHQFDELEVNGVCPYAESQKVAATAEITTATATLTAAQTLLTAATAAVTTATEKLTDAQEELAHETSKPNPQATKVQQETANVATAQTTVNAAVAAQTTAQAAVTDATTNLAIVEAAADAVISVVNQANTTVAAEKADPTPTKITICHVNNPGNGHVEAITVNTNGWADDTPLHAHHNSHVDDYIADANGACGSSVPTVNHLHTSTTTPTLTGTVGDVPLEEGEVFTVTVNAIIYDRSQMSFSELTWQLVIPAENKLSKGKIYEVDAFRNNQWHDITNDELEITDNIDICVNGVNQSIKRSDWEGSKESENYYLGACHDADSPPLPKSPKELGQALPDEPLALVNQYVPVTGLVYCDDGGIKSSNPATNVTIRRAQILNASTENGTVDLTGLPTKVTYGVKEPGVGAMDISNAGIDSGSATGVTLTGVTLNDAYIDTGIDYINSDGTVNSNGTYIKVIGGITKPTTLKEDNAIVNATIISGVITAGVDVNGDPVRGNISTGVYDYDIKNADTVITKGRRAKGTLVGATITNAKTTTVDGVTVVDAGTITGGTIENASTFGTVTNATLVLTNLANTNHCFSSGTVGSRGQLNWKEIIKD